MGAGVGHSNPKPPSPNPRRLDVAARQAALLQVLLVVVFGAVEGAGGDDLGGDGPAVAPAGLLLGAAGLGGGLLGGGVGEDDRAVLGAHIRPLAGALGRVVVGPEDG